MVGSRGKGSRSRSKSKGAVVPADPKPLNACPPNDGGEDNETSNAKGVVLSADPEPLIACLPNDGEEDNGTSNRAGISMEDKGKAELIADGGADVKGFTMDHGAFFAAAKENVKVCDGVDASINMDAEVNNKIVTEEQPEGEDVVCSEINNEMRNGEESEEEYLVDSGINNGKRNEEEQEKEDMVDSGNNNKITNEEDEVGDEEVEEEEQDEEDLINNGPDVIKCEEPKSPENTAEGAGINNDTECAAKNIEGMTSSKDGLEVSMTQNLLNNKEESEPNDEEPVSILPDNGGKISVEDGVEAVTKKVNQPRRKTTRTKLVRNKGTTPEMQPSDGIDGSVESSKGGASNEANPQSTVVKATLGEACQEDETKHVKNEGKSEVGNVMKVNRKKKRLRKKALQGRVVAPGSENNPKATNVEPKSTENNQNVEQDTKNEGGEKPEDRVSSLKKRKRNKVVKEGAQNVNANDVDKPGSSKKGNLSKRMEGMGMIFMCSSQTKKDCYQYKVLGLPAAKKELVSKIYKGMRLFLFDFELKMLYGIYKAAAPGGYDIEPRAFKSKFPAQVRFTVLEDCLPLAEEKFKSIIKDNYYTKNKFNCELTNEQVKNLCKLFSETTKKAGAKMGAGVRKPAASSSAPRDRKRKRMEDNPRVVPVPVTSSERKRSTRRAREEVRRAPQVSERSQRRAREEVRRAPQVSERSQRSAREEVRRAPLVTERSIRRPQAGVLRAPLVTGDRYRQPAIVYDRETFLPSVASASLYQPRLAEDLPHTRPLYQPLRAEDPHTRPSYQPLRIEDSPHTRAYAYERPREVDTYMRDYRDPTYPSSQELRYTVERDRADPYVPYSQPFIYREPEYRANNGREQYDYPSSVRYVEEYSSADHRAPLPKYRRY